MKPHEVHRALTFAGFEVEDGAKHRVYRHPCGAKVTVQRSTTPDPRQQIAVRRAVRLAAEYDELNFEPTRGSEADGLGPFDEDGNRWVERKPGSE